MPPVEGDHRRPDIAESFRKPIRISRGSHERIAFPSRQNRLADVFVSCDAIDENGISLAITDRENIADFYG